MYSQCSRGAVESIYSSCTGTTPSNVPAGIETRAGAQATVVRLAKTTESTLA